MKAPTHRNGDHAMRRHDEQGVTALIGLLIGIAVFSVVFYYLVDSAVKQNVDTSGADTENLDTISRQLASLFTQTGTDWYVGNEAIMCVGGKENPAALNPDALGALDEGVATGRFGLREEGCLDRDGPGGALVFSYPKLASMYQGQVEASANGKLDYEEALRSLDLEDRNLEVHVRSWPVLKSVREAIRSGQGDPYLKAAYVGDYVLNDGTDPIVRIVQHDSGVTDGSDDATIWVSITNDGTVATIFEIQFTLKLSKGTVYFTRHTPLLGPGEPYTAEVKLAKSTDWVWPNEGSNPGSIRLCTILLDPGGNIVDGTTLPASTIKVYGVDDAPGYSSVSSFPPTDFLVPTVLNGDLLGSDGVNDAACVTHTNLPLGGYFYGEATITGATGWATPEYNDQNTNPVYTISDFYGYSGELFTPDPNDDASRNTNADGHLILTAAKPARTIVLLNQHVGGAGGYTGPTPPDMVFPKEVDFVINDVQGQVGEGNIDFTSIDMGAAVQRPLRFVHADQPWFDLAGGASVSANVNYASYAADGSAVAAASFVAANGANNGGGSASLSLAMPTGTKQSDVMIAQITARGGTGTTYAAPPGWALIDRQDSTTTLGQAVYYKLAGASEAGPYSFAFSSSVKASGGIVTYRGIDVASPIDAFGGQPNGSGTSVTAPSITTTVPDTFLLGLFGTARGTTFGAPTGMTERWDAASAGGSTSSRTTSEGTVQTLASAGPTGARVASAGGSAVNIGHLVALRMNEADWTMQLLDAGSPFGAARGLPNLASGFETYTLTSATGYEARIHADADADQVWNLDIVNAHDGPVGAYTPFGTAGTYSPQPSALAEADYLEILLANFLRAVYDDAYADPLLLSDPQGDVYPDVKDVMNNVFSGLLVDDKGTPSPIDDEATLANYNVVVIGSNVEHEAMTSAVIKDAIEDWVHAGGTLIVLGSVEQNNRWLEPIFGADVESASGGLYMPDVEHPILNVPNTLDTIAYKRVTTWSFSPAYVDRFTHVIKEGPTDADPDLLTVSDSGSFGLGRVILSGYQPYDLTANQAGTCAMPLPAENDCESVRFMQNLLAQGYRELFLDFGPAIPEGVPNGVANRIAVVYHPDLGNDIVVHFLIYVFPG